MENDPIKNRSADGGGTPGDGVKSFDDRKPIQFIQVGMSKNGKWLFVDTISRAFIHINYLRAVDRNKTAALAQELRVASGAPAAQVPAQPMASTPPQKPKKARKENDRTS